MMTRLMIECQKKKKKKMNKKRTKKNRIIFIRHLPLYEYEIGASGLPKLKSRSAQLKSSRSAQ